MNFQQAVSNPEVKPGIYRHFKGRRYEVVGVAREVDSSDYFVVYRPLYGDKQLVVRSWADFMATVRQNDQEVPRFRYLKPPKVRGKHWRLALGLFFPLRKGRSRGSRLEQVP